MGLHDLFLVRLDHGRAARAAAVFVAACAGGAWYLYRQRRPRKTSLGDSASRPPAEPSEPVWLRQCLDLAISLHNLSFSDPPADGSGETDLDDCRASGSTADISTGSAPCTASSSTCSTASVGGASDSSGGTSGGDEDESAGEGEGDVGSGSESCASSPDGGANAGEDKLRPHNIVSESEHSVAEDSILDSVAMALESWVQEELPNYLWPRERKHRHKVSSTRSKRKKMYLPLPRRHRRLAGRKSKALACAVTVFLGLAFLLLLMAAWFTVVSESRTTLAGILAAGCSAAALPAVRRGLDAAKQQRVAAVRASVELPGSETQAVWRALAAWVAAKHGSHKADKDCADCHHSGKAKCIPQRGLGTRGIYTVAVEGSADHAGEVVGPLTAFVLEMPGPNHTGKISVHAYFMAATPMAPTAAKSVVTKCLQDLLGNISATIARYPALAPLTIDDAAVQDWVLARHLLGELP